MSKENVCVSKYHFNSNIVVLWLSWPVEMFLNEIESDDVKMIIPFNTTDHIEIAISLQIELGDTRRFLDHIPIHNMSLFLNLLKRT